ncbi:hypothetical protein [Rosenbergiella epipactidis]|uniref:hypothetical protein n=1 Tax=Rosenbergiella epipactidis TaxID=1544694 RepID=UPI001F4E8DFD|nr:hypothetical protein [Rosenbergiella epipactidis]
MIMTGKNIFLSLISILVLIGGLTLMQYNKSVPFVFSALASMYTVILSATEIGDFKNPKDKEYFVFFMKVLVAVVITTGAYFTQK